MATPLSRTDARVKHIRRLDDAWARFIPTTFRELRYTIDGSLVSLSDCDRLAKDIVLGVLCGISMGAFVAVAVGSL